ncbi:MAG: hypothetical protein ACP5H2_12515 [Solirubrobacteraceae bacterium]
MSLLEDAIREHLDLKRSHGADPAEVARQEREALGPVRREGFDAGHPAGPSGEGYAQTSPLEFHDSTAPHWQQEEDFGQHLPERDVAPEPPKRRRFFRFRRDRSHDDFEAAVPLDERDWDGDPDLLGDYEDDYHGGYAQPDVPMSAPEHDPFFGQRFAGAEPLHDQSPADSTPAERAVPEQLAPEQLAPEQLASEELASEELAPEELAPEELAPEELASEEPPAPGDTAHEQATRVHQLDHPSAPAGAQDLQPQAAAPQAQDDPAASAAAETEPPRLEFKRPPKRPHFDSKPEQTRHGDELQHTTEFDVQSHLDEEESDPDVLEETPEFLNDTPEHDRLWFEQQPPQDFDFGG